MDFAISMYKGGIKVYADECDFYSYSKLGLICPFCRKEVYLRKGNVRKPYFAHFHATSSKQVEKCELRASVYGNSTETSNFIEDRGQRLKIFHEHFLSIIYIGEHKIINDIKFNDWHHSIKFYNNQAINNITKYCLDYFLIHRQIIENKFILHLALIKDKQIMLQQEIALEAMVYLCDKYRLHLLEYLLHYSIYQLYKYEQFKLFRQEITTKDIENICQYVGELIMGNPWINALHTAKELERKKKACTSSDNSNSHKIKVLPSQAYNVVTGKSRLHRSGGYYDSHLNATKNKRSTGVKLSTTIQKNIDTCKLSKPFVIPGFKAPLQLQISNTGNIILNEFNQSGYRTIATIAKICDYHFQQTGDTNNLVFDWTYYKNIPTNLQNEIISKQIDRMLTKSTNEAINIIIDNKDSKQEQPKKLSRNARNKLRRKMANTIDLTNKK